MKEYEKEHYEQELKRLENDISVDKNVLSYVNGAKVQLEIRITENTIRKDTIWSMLYD